MSRSPDPSRRRVLAALAASAAVAPFGALAQGISKRPVRIVVPFTPAAGPDIVARLLAPRLQARWDRSEEHTSELQSRLHLVCRLLLEKKKIQVLSVPLSRHT